MIIWDASDGANLRHLEVSNNKDEVDFDVK